MFQTKPVVVQTSNFGGAQGTSFNDNEAVTNFPNTDPGLTIDPVHPIKQMDIYGGWVVDAISTTYRLSDGTTKVIKRGSNQSADNLQSVVLNDNEIISQICGFAGPYQYYNQSLLIQVQLVIFDTKTGAVRVAGPFGGTGGLASGQLFSVSNPMALAGFETAGSAQTGISGLSVVKNNMAE
ncbi:lectin [Mycena sanguinolenta]|nr:lectin [Mycena sanguinolenta]